MLAPRLCSISSRCLSSAGKVAVPRNHADQATLRNLWSNQLRDGKARGAWIWFDNGLDPMDTDYSNFYGAMLAERA